MSKRLRKPTRKQRAKALEEFFCRHGITVRNEAPWDFERRIAREAAEKAQAKLPIMEEPR